MRNCITLIGLLLLSFSGYGQQTLFNISRLNGSSGLAICNNEAPVSFIASSVPNAISYTWYINGSSYSSNVSGTPPSYVLARSSWGFGPGTTIRCEADLAGGGKANSITLTTTTCVPPVLPNFWVGIQVLPDRYPKVYCADEITFVATSSHPATFYWYKNGSNIWVGPTYDPVFFEAGDELYVQAFANATTGLANYTAQSSLAGIFRIQENVGPVEAFVTDHSTAACQGTSTSFYAVETNAVSFSWSVSPSGAGTITPSVPNSASINIQWNAGYNGNVQISCTANGCSSSSSIQLNYFIHPSPVIQPIDLQYCNFEAAKLIGDTTTDLKTFNWYNDASVFLEQSTSLNLGIFKDGIHHYKYEAISDLGCKSATKENVSVSIISSGCEDKLNWIESIGYDNEGEVAHSKSYFDVSGGLLQSQVKNYTNDEILTSQTIFDEFNRSVASTLVAPTDKTEFQYHHYFATNSSGGSYNYLDFDQPLGNDEQGTVGWYYSSNNNKESHVPTTGYPYSRTEFYNDGTAESKKSGGSGEALKLGMGHETISGTFPVFNELNDYLSKRVTAIPGISQTVTSLKNEGLQSVGRDQNGRYRISITDKSGKTVMSARAGTEGDKILSIVNEVTSSGDPASVNYRHMTYFYLLSEQVVSISGSTDFVVEDIVNDVAKLPGQTFATTNGKWPVGFYRLLLNNATSQVTITYTNYFLDVSYQFYDDAGRLVSSVSPNGFKQLKETIAYSNIDKTTYQYNFRGWLTEMNEPEAGTTKYLYRKDGSIRFSQNAQQRDNEEHITTSGAGKGKFSYTNYDDIGRPVESGEYIGALAFSSLNASLEFGDQVSYSTTERKDWVTTHYNYADPNLLSVTGLSADYKQDYVRGGVSWTENANIKTWYSYDEFGRVVWMARKPTLLPRVFVVKYQYDFLGNVVSVSNLGFDLGGHVMEQFFHHYTYDMDNRLSKAFTSTELTGDKKLRATYEYYLHGPLKRIELGESIQGIDFVYNIHGWLTQINHPDASQDPGDDGNDVFGMVLDYYDSDVANIYGSTTTGSIHDSIKRHGLPFNMVASSIPAQQPLLRFAPDLIGSTSGTMLNMKGFSAENLNYQKMISEIKEDNKK